MGRKTVLKRLHDFTRQWRRALAALLLMTLTVGAVSGCGGKDGTTADGATGGSEDSAQCGVGLSGEETGQSWPADTPLGRYVEQSVELPEGVTLSGAYERFHKLADGSLILTEGGIMLRSKDNGKSWEEDKRPWMTRMEGEGKYIMDIAIGSDGTVAVVWMESLEEDALEKSEDDGKTDTAERGDVTATEDSSENETAGSLPTTLDTKLLIVKPDGTEIAVEPVLEEDDFWVSHVYISGTGSIIAGTLGANLYEVSKEGKFEYFLTVEEGRPELIRFHGNLMLMDGWGYQTPLIYDMDTEKYLDDSVLEDFVDENYSDRDSYSGEYYDMFFLSGGDDIIYLAGNKGLYRHVLGGSVMEQVVDGSLSSFSNPSCRIVDMAVLQDNEFLAAYTNGKLVRYVYDSKIPTVPVGKLKVYSLEEKPSVRQTVSLYQTAYPQVYVEYEIGMAEGNAVTREDALKKLNTQILAGEGPDVLILDNMPIDSYMEKGLLADLGPLLDEMSGEDGIFENVRNAFTKDGHIYTVPCELQMPFILGRSGDVAQMKDLEQIADAVEHMRESNPGADLLEIASAKGIMRVFSMVSAPAWKTERGEVDTEAITDFLTQTKRIYDAQMDGLSEKAIEGWKETSDAYIEELGKSIEDTDRIRMYEGEMNFMGGQRKFAMGSLVDWYEYSRQISICASQGFEDCEIIPMNGQCENVFWARTMLGISAASQNGQIAEDFLRTALGRENQKNLLGGMAVTKEGLLADLDGKKSTSQDNTWGCSILSNEEGLYVYLELCIPDEDEVEALFSWIESADTAYIEDVAFEEVVYEEGIAYMHGEQSLEGAVLAIEDKLALYLAE